MSANIGNGKISGLISYLDSLSTKGKVRSSVVTPLKSSVKSIFSIVDGEEWQDVDARSVDLDDYINRFKNLTIGKYDAASYTAYRTRAARALNWYSNFLQNPGWSPTVRSQQNDKKKVKTPDYQISQNVTDLRYVSEGEVIPTEHNPVLNKGPVVSEIDPSAKLIGFPFPMTNGVIATLYLPQSITPSDAERLRAFIQTLVIEQKGKNETQNAM